MVTLVVDRTLDPCYNTHINNANRSETNDDSTKGILVLCVVFGC
jgi:hypothetical protein